MIWKKIGIGILILLGVGIFIIGILYLSAIDLSKKHTAYVNALPLYTDEVDTGDFRLAVGDFEFLIRVAGMQNEGPAMILLHGFPESSLMWQSLLDTAAAKGYRVLAFDQRGYSPKARPSGVENYHIDHLVQDVLNVADAVGFDKFHLIGHDWGSAVGWMTTMEHPERIESWTAMAIAHPGVFFPAIINHPEQKKRSSYMSTLRMPIIPELFFQLNKDSFSERLKGVWTDKQIATFKAIQSEHGALTAALNWYRAVDFEGLKVENSFDKVVTRPSLFIWGSEDGVIAEEIIPEQEAFIEAAYATLRLKAGHSLMQEKPDSIMQAIFEHVGIEVDGLGVE